MVNISTETVTVALVSDHCRKPIGFDFPCFFILASVRVVLSKVSEQKPSCAEIVRTYL